MNLYRVNRPSFNSYWFVQQQTESGWVDISMGFERFVYADLFRLGCMEKDKRLVNEGYDETI